MRLFRILLSFFLFTGVSLAQFPAPLITQPLVPTSVAPGGAAFTLTVNGSGFAVGAQVFWNGTSRRTTFVSAAQLTANILAGDIATAGTASVKVLNPGPRRESNVVLFPITTPASTLAFASTTIPANGNPDHLVSADLNRDGKADLVVCKDFSQKVSVMLGHGDGTFQAAKDYFISVGCKDVVTGDFNGDHILDIAASNGLDVVLLIGRGDGTMRMPLTTQVAHFPADIIAGDFNGDGKLDLAVATDRTGASAASVLLGNGDGTFQAHVDYPVEDGGSGITTADFNGDGKLDLAVATKTTNNVSVLIGVGDGTFATPVTYSAGINPGHLTAADFNGDGKVDLLVSDLNPTNYPISVLPGNGDGTFQPRKAASALGFGIPMLGDVNGDGNIDIVLTSDTGAVVLGGNGQGAFGTPQMFSTTSAIAAALGDFNGDGKLDIAVGGFASETVVVLLQTTAGLSPTSLDFGNQTVGTTMTMPLMLTNLGTTDMTLQSIKINGPARRDYTQSTDCGTTLTVGSSCTINVTFRPSTTGGRSATLSVTDSAPGPQVVTLFGVGT